MSGIGEAASIAGLVAIAGQSLNISSKLFGCIKAYQSVIPQAHKLAGELNQLQDCFVQIQHITSQAIDFVPELSYHVGALLHQVSACQLTMTTMLQKLQNVDPNKRKLRWKQIKVAADGDFFIQLQAQIACEKQNLILKLEAVNCALDICATTDLQRLTVTTSSIDRNLGDMMQHLDARSSSSDRHLREMDARIRKLQRSLELSIRSRPAADSSLRARQGRTRARRRVSQKATRLELTGDRGTIQQSAPCLELVRLVSPGLLMREERGMTHTDLVSLEMRNWSAFSTAHKLSMIRYLQGLRLLIWLLRWDNYVSTSSARNLNTVRSSLAVQAGIVSLWEFSSAYSDIVASSEPSLRLSGRRLPWFRCAPWVRYVLCRSIDWRKHGENDYPISATDDFLSSWGHFLILCLEILAANYEPTLEDL